MLKQKFRFNDNTDPELYVVASEYHKYEAMTIQISKVLDMDNAILRTNHAEIPYRYVYEEVNSDDFVQYARFMGEDNIRRNYPWALKMM